MSNVGAKLSKCERDVIDLAQFLLSDFLFQIPMQQARIKGAWLPSEIFQKNGNAAERKKTIVNRLRRAIKRGKFSRAAWVFDVVLNLRQ